MMEDHHTTNFNELKMLAEQKQITIPMSVNDEGIKEYNKLGEKQGAEFDKDYLNMMVEEHEEAVKEFEEFVSQTKDQEIKAWADKTLATLRTHLTQTDALHKKT
jgi:putative membrane protein